MQLDERVKPGAPIRALPKKRLTSQDAINAVVASEGDLDLAAERLFGFSPLDGNGAGSNSTDEGIGSAYGNKTKLIALLAEDASAQQDLQRILRTLSLLKAFSTFNNVSVTVDGTLDTMDGNQRARLMTKLLDTIAILTDDHTQTLNSNQTRLNLNMTEAVMKNLPPDVQQAIKMLSVGSNEGELSNTDTETFEADWSLGNPPPNAAVDDEA